MDEINIVVRLRPNHEQYDKWRTKRQKQGQKQFEPLNELAEGIATEGFKHDTRFEIISVTTMKPVRFTNLKETAHD